MPKINMPAEELSSKISEYSELCFKNGIIDPVLYAKYDVKRGLRDIDGKGVLTGLTKISDIRQNKIVDGVTVPCDGQLFYRGINVKDLIAGCETENRMKKLFICCCSVLCLTSPSSRNSVR